MLAACLLPSCRSGLNVSLTPWLSDFHTVRFSGRSGYFCFSVCCCLCKVHMDKAKGWKDQGWEVEMAGVGGIGGGKMETIVLEQ